jgi:hypothetical protein
MFKFDSHIYYQILLEFHKIWNTINLQVQEYISINFFTFKIFFKFNRNFIIKIIKIVIFKWSTTAKKIYTNGFLINLLTVMQPWGMERVRKKLSNRQWRAAKKNIFLTIFYKKTVRKCLFRFFLRFSDGFL